MLYKLLQDKTCTGDQPCMDKVANFMSCEDEINLQQENEYEEDDNSQQAFKYKWREDRCCPR